MKWCRSFRNVSKPSSHLGNHRPKSSRDSVLQKEQNARRIKLTKKTPCNHSLCHQSCFKSRFDTMKLISCHAPSAWPQTLFHLLLSGNKSLYMTPGTEDTRSQLFYELILCDCFFCLYTHFSCMSSKWNSSILSFT